jgi:molybdate transport system regulatory protein
MKEESYKINYKLWIENSEGKSLFGDGKWELLCAIEETGSLKSAIEKMNWTYRATWNKLKDIEKKLGFKIIERTRGGTGGGGHTFLTEEGKQFVELFSQIHKDSDLQFEKISKKYNDLLKKQFI